MATMIDARPPRITTTSGRIAQALAVVWRTRPPSLAELADAAHLGQSTDAGVRLVELVHASAACALAFVLYAPVWLFARPARFWPLAALIFAVGTGWLGLTLGGAL